MVGTTGFTDEDLERFRAAFTNSNCLIAPNFAIGAILMMRFAELAAPWFETAEMIELHHDHKVDAPSGTAMRTVERMAAASSDWAPDPTTTHILDGARGAEGPAASGSTRCGCGGWSPTRRCCSAPPGETLSIRHDTYDRSSFMPGVLLGVKRSPTGPASPSASTPSCSGEPELMNVHRSIFSGVGVALVTLFDDEGEIDAPATADLAARLVDEGMMSVLVAGSTGEAATLDVEERSDLLLAVRSAVDGKVPVLAGTGAASTRQAVLLSRRAADDGADGLVVLSPPDAVDPRPYYERVTAAVDVPVLAYHWPKMSAPGIPVDVLAELPVAGIKDSSGEAERLLLEADVLGAGVYTGSPALVHTAAAVGCAGRHPGPRQRRSRGLRPGVARRRRRPTDADQRPPGPGARRHRRPQAGPLRPARHQPVHPHRLSAGVSPRRPRPRPRFGVVLLGQLLELLQSLPPGAQLGQEEERAGDDREDEQRHPVVADEAEDVVDGLPRTPRPAAGSGRAGRGCRRCSWRRTRARSCRGAGEQAERVVRGDEDERVRRLAEEPLPLAEQPARRSSCGCSIHVMAVSPYQWPRRKKSGIGDQQPERCRRT